MKIKYLITLLFFASLITISCGKHDISKTGEASSATGWEYNSAENGGFSVVTDYTQQTGPGLVFIEGGTFTMGRVEQDLTWDWNNVPEGLR